MFSRAPEPWATPARSVAVRTLRPACGALVLALTALAGCRSEPRQEHLQHGRFDDVDLRVPHRARGVVLLLARPEDAALAERISSTATERGAVVVRVDATAFARVLDATPSGCVFPSGDLDNLAHFVQAYLTLPSYEPAILVGVGLGAHLVAGALNQAPSDTFAGAISIGDCPGAKLQRPLCPREVSVDARADGVDPPPTVIGGRTSCTSGADATSSEIDAALAPLPAALGRLVEAARARAIAAPSDMADLPITEVVAAGGDHPDTFGILLSGDGGWAGIDKALSARLARRGLPIVGIDSLRYFWRARTPESSAADLDRVIRRYQLAWRRRSASAVARALDVPFP